MTRYAALALSTALSAMAFSGVARAQDETAELVVRMNRLEGQVRQLSGQVEQLQYENRQTKDQLRKFQEDVEFRFQERSGGRPSAAPPAAGQSTSAPPRPARRSDAFDPDQQPAAPGAPRPLGQAAAPAPSIPETRPDPRRGETAFSEGAPLDLNAAARGGAAPQPRPAGPPPSSINPATVSGLNPGLPGAGSTPPAADPTRAEYDSAYGLVRAKQYGEAETALRRFVAAHPKDRLAGDAVYWLGESYLQQNRPREAAEQFLKVSTEHSRSAKAPDALLKLGVSLSSLGAKDQACATFAELGRKYPAASPSVKQDVEREQKRARCPA